MNLVRPAPALTETAMEATLLGFALAAAFCGLWGIATLPILAG